MRAALLTLTMCLLALPAYAKYSGGTGEPNDPYQIATAADLIALGEDPNDYDKHFILTADIDLDPNLPGRKVFDKAVIAPDTNPNDLGTLFQGTPFTGVFDGNGHTVLHLSMRGFSFLGLFGQLTSGAAIKDLGVVDVNIIGSGDYVGGLVGYNGYGNIGVTQCYSTATISGRSYVGGLIGVNLGNISQCYSAGSVSGNGEIGGLVGYNDGTVTNCYSASRVTGKDCVGGLAGCHGRFDWGGTVTNCHSTGAVKGDECVGGLVGYNWWGEVSQSYSTGGVNGTREVGGVVGRNEGGVDYCYSTGTVSGGDSVGGLVGNNLEDVFRCYSSGVVDGNDYVGGLVGKNFSGNVVRCESASTVDGNSYVGGLVGGNRGMVTDCYATGVVDGNECVGGLVGYHNTGFVTRCYSTGAVDGSESVGGLVGYAAYDEWTGVAGCFWDTQTSGQATSAGGDGKTTAEMQTASTFLDAAWDFVGETKNGTEDIWWILEGKGYPRLSWEPRRYGGGTGEPNDPYQIATAADLIALGNEPNDYDKHFVLVADIDLDPNLPGRRVFDKAVIAPDANDVYGSFEGTPFTGVLDGNGHTILHLTIKGRSHVGLFGQLGSWDAAAGEVRNLGLADVNATGSGDVVGGLVGWNWGIVNQCYSTGIVDGNDSVGGLAGGNGGIVIHCYSASGVTGDSYAAGLVGRNSLGIVTHCYSTGAVSGIGVVGGLVGGTRCLGGVCLNDPGVTDQSFWDTQTSGQAESWRAGGVGLTTAEMQTAKTFLDAGWDFTGETTNGTEDIWWILEGKDYPRLWWEAAGDPNATAGK